MIARAKNRVGYVFGYLRYLKKLMLFEAEAYLLHSVSVWKISGILVEILIRSNVDFCLWFENTSSTCLEMVF